MRDMREGPREGAKRGAEVRRGVGLWQGFVCVRGSMLQVADIFLSFAHFNLCQIVAKMQNALFAKQSQWNGSQKPFHIVVPVLLIEQTSCYCNLLLLLLLLLALHC